MNQYLKFTIDGIDRNDCSCISLESVIVLGAKLTALGSGTNNVSLVVLAPNGTKPVDYSATGVGVSTTIADQTFTVSIPGIYTIQLTVTIDGVDTVLEETFKVCPFVDIVTDSCGSYTLTNNYSANVIVTLKDINGVVVFDGLICLAGKTLTFNLLTPGVYILGYLYVDGNAKLSAYYVPIYFFCTIEACYLSLLKKILCQSEMDPCCKECNDEQKKEIEELRFELNKLSALFNYYKAIVLYSKSKWLGAYTISAEEREDLIAANDLLAKIIEITKRCGIEKCDGVTVSDVGCGCS